MRALYERLLFTYWDSQARYLSGRLIEIETEAQHVEARRKECAERLRKAWLRATQYAGLA